MSVEFPLSHSHELWLKKSRAMAPEDHLKESAKVALPQLFTLFLISFGSLLDFLILTDELAAGRISTTTALVLRVLYVPPLLVSTLVNFFLVAHTDPGFVGNKRIHGKREQEQEGGGEEGGSALMGACLPATTLCLPCYLSY